MSGQFDDAVKYFGRASGLEEGEGKFPGAWTDMHWQSLLDNKVE
jgi:hypothetical protein